MARTDIRLARSRSVAYRRKYWKKNGKKINARKRQRREDTATKTAYTNGDYKWVKDTINQYHKSGISLRELWRISSEGKRGMTGLRSELPPGRAKISQIVTDKDGKDWEVNKSKGGRGNPTVIRPIKLDVGVVLERLGAVMIPYSGMVEELKSFKKKAPAFERFKRKDFFLYASLKDQMLRLPMKIFLTRGRSGSDKQSVFNMVVSDIQRHLKTMKKIEEGQGFLDKDFPKILEYLKPPY